MLKAAQNIKQKNAGRPLKSLIALLLTFVSSGYANTDVSLPNSLQHYENRIEQMEANHGPYHTQLAQELTSLGQHYRQQGELDDSREVLQRAMHISRVNTGLYNLEQTAIIEQLVQTNTELNDWEQVDANKHYLYWLYKRNYAQDDPRMLPILNSLGRWHLNIYDEHNHKGNIEHLLRAHNFYKQAINIVSKEFGEMDPQLVDHLHGYTATNYYLAAHQMVIHQEADDQGSARNTNISNEEKRRLLQYIQNSFRNGKNSIGQAIRIHHLDKNSTLQDKVAAELAMADWNLLFGRWHTALALYKNIYSSLKTQLNPQLSPDTVFGQPVPLPQLPSLVEDNLESSASEPYIVVAFDVSPRGSARNIDFIEEFPKGHIQNRIRVRRTLKSSKFRPRMEQGEPVITQRYSQKFIFPEKTK